MGMRVIASLCTSLIIAFSLEAVAQPQPIWVPQSSGTNYQFYDVHFVNASTGIVSALGGLLRTTDGGATWTLVYSGTSQYTRYLIAVAFADSNHGTAVGLWGALLRTTDGGLTWTRQKVPGYSLDIPTHLYDVAYNDNGTGIMVGRLGYIARSTDAGASWGVVHRSGPTLWGLSFR